MYLVGRNFGKTAMQLQDFTAWLEMIEWAAPSQRHRQNCCIGCGLYLEPTQFLLANIQESL